MQTYIPSYKQAAMTIAILTIIFTAGITDGYNCCSSKRNPKEATRQREDVMSSIESADFEGWQQSVGTEYVLENNISRSDFENYVQIREAARSGYYEKSLAMANRLSRKFKNLLA